MQARKNCPRLREPARTGEGKTDAPPLLAATGQEPHRQPNLLLLPQSINESIGGLLRFPNQIQAKNGNTHRKHPQERSRRQGTLATSSLSQKGLSRPLQSIYEPVHANTDARTRNTPSKGVQKPPSSHTASITRLQSQPGSSCRSCGGRGKKSAASVPLRGIWAAG